MEKKGTGLVWSIIVFCLIFIMPLGVVLLFMKLAIDKSVLISGETEMISAIGWAMTIIGGIFFLSEFSVLGEFSGRLYWGVVFVSGIIASRWAKKIKKNCR